MGSDRETPHASARSDAGHLAATMRLTLDNDRLLRSVVANSPIIISALDSIGTVMHAAGQGLAAQGLAASEILGRSVFEIYAGDPEFLANVRRALAGETFSAVNETRGAIFERTFQPVCDAQGEVEMVICVAVDITRPVLAERRATDSERLLRSVVDALPHFVVFKDRDLRYRLVNESFARFHRMAVEDMIGKRGEELPRRTDENQALFTGDDRRVIDDGEVVHRSGYAARTPEGELVDFDAIKLPVRDDSGRITGVVGVIDNITESRRAQRELQRYRDHLEDLVEARTEELLSAQDELVRSERLVTIGQITATVSHELRNPLGTIRSSFEALRPYVADLDGRPQRALERIERNIDRCVRIIDELLGYTRARALQIERVELDRWVEDVIGEMEVPAGVTLALDTESATQVRIDPERMRQALVNLVQNAFQALASDRAAPGAGQVTVSTRLEGTRPSIVVTDTGPGVDPEVRARMFEPLFSTRAFGVGLGLPLVRSIAQQHGGEVEHLADAAPGCTFRLWLPASVAAGDGG